MTSCELVELVVVADVSQLVTLTFNLDQSEQLGEASDWSANQ